MFTQIDAVGFNDPTLISTFIKFLCKELQINPKTITVESMHNNVYLSTDRSLGLCIDIEHEEFLIMVYEGNRNITEICNTIAHEMIHVKQYLKENLNHWISTCGEVPYSKRWWEVEARSDSPDLVKKFAESIK